MIDQTTGQKVVLSDADVQLVKNICSNRFITPEEDQYPVGLHYFYDILYNNKCGL